MRLFYIQGACSLATHIILNEIDAEFNIESVDIENDRTASGLTYSTINPKQKVPALQLDSSEIITENIAILQYLADSHSDLDLAPAPGTLRRAKLDEYLSFASSEYHKAFGPLFSKHASVSEKQTAIRNVESRLDYLDQLLAGCTQFVMGGGFTIADAYLFVISNWTHFVGIDLSRWNNVLAYVERIGQRSSVKKAMSSEGLSKS
ncbi:glutathione transferase GstA [Alteromonadaceae bacterium M269]|nr:glutathione transferase GstA [Alteromonadaceae bacterium M269]